jgi:YVTN family beta-propeller protein
MSHLRKKLLPIVLLVCQILWHTVAPAQADTVISSIATGGTDLHSLAVDTVRDKIYTVDGHGHAVTVIDGKTGTASNVPIDWSVSWHVTSNAAVVINPVTNKIYAANEYASDLTIIDGATNTTSTIAGASIFFWNMAVNPVTNRVYVLHSGYIKVIDDTNTVIATLVVLSGPSDVAVNAVTNKVYVTNQYNNNVMVLDGTTNTISTVTSGSKPGTVAVNSVTNMIYVVNSGSANVTVIDGATNATTTVAVGTNPSGVAVNPVTNKIYVTNLGSNTVTVIDGATNATTTVAVGTNPSAVAVNPVTNKIYVGNRSSANVSVIDGATNLTRTLTTWRVPQTLAVNSVTNRIYVGTSQSVIVIDGAADIAPVTSGVVEFYNIFLDHYFITADSNEAAAIDGGSAGPGWVRTGNSFKSGGNTPVCRFYGSLSPGPNSHFYTLAGTECDGLKALQQSTPATQKRWNFESLDFISTPPITNGVNGTCPTGTVPVYRAYNNGSSRGVDSNHRITANRAAIEEVVARGWSEEGVVMCAPN